MGLRQLRDVDPGTGATAGDRQRHPHRWPAGPGAGGKYADHLPLYRQERMFGRAGLEIPRSTLAEWVGACGVQLQPLVDALRNTLLEHSVLHADETPVSMLAPGKKKTHKAYVWAYCTTPFADLKAAIYDFAPSRAGEHARTFLGDWRGKLVCDDYAGYKAGFGNGITEIGCMAHARRKFYDLHEANKRNWRPRPWNTSVDSTRSSGKPKICHRICGGKSGKPKPNPLPMRCISGCWPIARKCRMAPARPKPWITASNVEALTRYLDDGAVPIDNNWVENQIRPWRWGAAIGCLRVHCAVVNVRLRS
jgi:hypothetical protein